ncbi:hypothetical protein QN277_019417 [Acacia crassicarpa]|uniref:Uncharacterized protein n=1 Tax=Acacia crassicarpa TaxID=499986 RepID=A0AAE1KBM2_9FABA|nr:hypothetical protein QN277_019417 [Acacia crassicarpa]
MDKTTSLRYSSSTLLLLLFLLVLTSTATTSSSSNKQQDEQRQEEGPHKKLSMVDIRNDLPPNSPRLYVLGTFQSTEAPIDPGKSYNFVARGEVEVGIFTMDNQCAKFVAFDPNVELGRHAIFWSVRSDGPYHSWDRSNWQKKASWQPIDNC